MDALPALLHLVSHTRRTQPLELLAKDGDYTLASACTVILQRAGFDVQLVEGSFRYMTPQMQQSSAMGVYGLWVPMPGADPVFVDGHGAIGEEAAIHRLMSTRYTDRDEMLATLQWDNVRLHAGSIPAQEHLDQEIARNETPTQRYLPSLLAEGQAMLDAWLLQARIPQPTQGRAGPRL